MSCEHCRDLELELAVVRAERDMLLVQRAGVKDWLGELLNGSPIQTDPLHDAADMLAKKYPEKKIYAIKELRTLTSIGLKEAKDAMDAAYDRAQQEKWARQRRALNQVPPQEEVPF